MWEPGALLHRRALARREELELSEADRRRMGEPGSGIRISD
jgi:hypothetical protein